MAIAITGALAARHQGTIEVLREHASLLDLTHDTIFVRDHDDVITYWNRAADGALRLAAASRRSAARQPSCCRPEFPAPFEAIMAELARSGRWEGELVHTTRDGRRVDGGQPLGAAARRPRPAGGHPGDQQRHHRAPRTVEDGLHRARSELAHVARVATLGELTASIAHEVNQPLAAVVTNGEACLRWLARDVPDLGQARSSVEHMIRNGQRASEVVRRLRALSRKADPSYAAALPGRRRQRRGAAGRPRAARAIARRSA